jgi:hypothetical protein
MRLQRKHRQPDPGFKRYVGYVSTGLIGSKNTFEFDVEEDASEQDIEEAARDAMFELIEWGFDPAEESK